MTTAGASPNSTLPVLLRPRPEPIVKRPALVEKRPRIVYTPPEWLETPPEWVSQPPEPRTYLVAGWRKINDGINDGTDRLFLGAVLVGVWYLLTFRPWVPDVVAGLVWLGALGYGVGVMWMCATGSAPWKWTVRRAAVVTALLSMLGGLWLASGALITLILVSGLAAQAFAYRPVSPDAEPAWWSDRRLTQDWAAAGIFGAKAPEDLWFRRIVPVALDDNGIRTTTVVPMAGPRKDARVLNVGADAVERARPALERVMGLKVGQLHISHDDDHDAGAITLTVTPPPRKDVVKAVLPPTWDYDHDLFIGRDARAVPHERPTWGRHAMFVGATGSGKTWAGRYEIAHAVLDPRISFYLIDGKGDAVDWEPLHPLCKRVVLGASRSAAQQAYAVLQEIEAVSDSRSALLGEADGIVVVVDEWYRLIGAARRHDPQMAKEMASLFSELLATARSRRIRFLTFWQRGTDSYIDTDMRGNMVQRFVGITGDKADARYPLDAVPDSLPKAPGQFNYKDSGSRPVLVTMPALDREAFAAACARGLRLRAGVAEAPSDPLTEAVHRLLAVEPMKPSLLLTMLPEEIRPATAQALGYALKKMDGVEAISISGHRNYRLTPGRAPSTPAEAPTYGTSTGDLSVPEPASADQEVSP